jgi:hypothetical protein
MGSIMLTNVLAGNANNRFVSVVQTDINGNLR